jgi:hypothetical protein
VKARQDQLQLARIPVDVADRENSGHRSLEFLGVDRDQVLVEIEAPFGDRPELHGKPEERQHPRAGNFDVAVRSLDGRRFERAAAAFQGRHLANLKFQLLHLLHGVHLVDAVGSGAKFRPPVNERDALCDGLEIERPVER